MYKHILLPVDLEAAASSAQAIEAAVAQAQTSGATLHVMTVVPDFGMTLVGTFFPEGFEKVALEEARKRLHQFTAERVPEGIEVQHIVGHGVVYKEILRVADEIDCDLVIMQSHHPELQDYLIGPNASRVVRHVNCSVQVVRGE